jgi:hypothetical protein
MKNKLLNIIISLSFIVSAVFACTGNCYEPIANAGYDASYYQGSTVVLDGSESYDPDIESGCSDGVSLNPDDCCNNNGGVWKRHQNNPTQYQDHMIQNHLKQLLSLDNN